MELQQCWTRYLKAEQLMEQGHWPEAHYLYEDVLHHLPTHIQTAVNDHHVKPCQFACLLSGLKDAAVSQSQIYNQLGRPNQAFTSLNQSYALLQFLSIEPSRIIASVHSVLSKHCDDLLHHMAVFCHAQRDAQWLVTFGEIEQTHQQFNKLKIYSDLPPRSCVIN